LLPRVLEAGRTDDAQRARWAVEDAWRNPLVCKRWSTFARLLTAEQCEALVARATARKLGTQVVERMNTAQATDGWNLASRGYVPHAVLMRRSGPARPPRGASGAAVTLATPTAEQAALPLF
jgi:hypothetical protein